MKTLKNVGLVFLIILAALSFLYLNYCPDTPCVSELTFDPEMADVKVSKFIFESLKKVTLSAF